MGLIKKNYKIILFCLIISSVVLLFTSSSSPLYPNNFAHDVNVYFTIGRGWLNGKIPYKDLFDQKGPIVFLIYMIGALITSKSFFGIYLLEIVSMTFFLFYSDKVISLFMDRKNSLYILPILTTLICTTTAFTSGGTAEEFVLPFYMFSIYYLLRYFKKQDLSLKHYFINGIMAGIVFMIKFNLIFFYFGFMMCIFIDLLIKKEVKKAFKSGVVFVLGMIIPFALFNIYFIMVNAIKDFYQAYFYLNIFSYGNTNTLLVRFQTSITNFIYRCLDNGFIILPLYICFLCFVQNMKIKTKYKAMLYITFILSIIGVFFGSNYHYYIIPLFSFLIFALMALCVIFKKIIKKIENIRPLFVSLLIILYSGLIVFAYKGANYKSTINTDIEDYGIYAIVEEINKAEDKTLLNYEYLDNGIYNLAGIIPNIKYFFRLNVSEERYPDIMNSQRSYIKEGKTNFVLLTNKGEDDEVYDLLEDKYELVKKVTHVIKNADDTEDIKVFELYKRVTD